MFKGRKQELEILNDLYAEGRAALVVVYGRRRIGKTALIQEFSRQRPSLYFEGMEAATTAFQVARFKDQFALQTGNRLLEQVSVKEWYLLFEELTNFIKRSEKKVIVTFDEFQWMAAGRVELVSLLKHYWDTQWKNQRCLIVLCGSIASYMVHKVVRSKSLYGRISKTIPLGPLSLSESSQMLHKRSTVEVLDYLMIFGGVPKYLEEINQKKSFNQNVQDLCFRPQGFLFAEMSKIFFSQFKEAKTYQKIVQSLVAGPMHFAEIAEKLKKSPSGSFKGYLENLEAAGFITKEQSVFRSSNKSISYKLSDPFLIFYFKYIYPLRRQISVNPRNQFFEKLILPNWQQWRGFSFENLCRLNAMEIARIAKFDHEVIDVSPFWKKKTANEKGIQIDLVYKRESGLYTICEVKFLNREVTTAVIPEMESKVEWLKNQGIKKVETMLVSNAQPSKELVSSDYFHHIVNAFDLFAN